MHSERGNRAGALALFCPVCYYPIAWERGWPGRYAEGVFRDGRGRYTRKNSSARAEKK
jgi:hypothetical protein